MPVPTALIAGATGAVAKRLVETLEARGWPVVGLSRNPPPARGTTRHLGVDLLDADAMRAALAPHAGITHVFYCARARHGEGGVESVDENVAMLRNVIDAAQACCPGLTHVHLVEGGKWYGLHLGPYPTPAHEDDPRHMPPNFYFDQQDLLEACRKGRRWSWSASRPNVLCDFAPERARNLVSILGAWAAICRELGMDLDFPGQPAHYHALTEITDASLHARAMAFIATEPGCADRAFNVTNGDVFRWQRVWPVLAGHFGMKPGIVRPIVLAEWMRDKGPVWDHIVARQGLLPRRLDEVAVWGFADFVFRQGYDVVSSTTRLRLAGFTEMCDSTHMLLAHLARYRAARIIP